MWTWEHPDGVHRAQIDHILLRGKWKNSIRKCRAYSSVELGSDHRIVTAKLKISLRVPSTIKKILQRDMQALSNSPDLQESYRVEVSNRFAALSIDFNEKSCQEKYDKIVNILEKANSSIIPKKTIRRENWVSRETEYLMEHRTALRNRYRNHRNSENYENWKDAARMTNESFEDDKQKFLEHKCQQAEEASQLNQSSRVYSIIRDISGKSTKNTAMLVNKQNGESPIDKEDLLKEWAKYFKNLLNMTNDTIPVEILPAANDLDITTDNFTLKELQDALNKMKSNKSPGTDFSVTVETLKYGGTKLQSAVLDICNSVLNDLAAPLQWTESIIIPIPKKASKSMKDFRGISLMSITAKIYNRMLLNRIYDPIDKLLRPFQAGFRKSRNCAEQIHVVRRIMEAYYQRQLPLIATFIDFQKAFDSIDRNIMWKILRSYGIPTKIVNAIAAIYSNSKSKVRLGESLSEAFCIKTGVLQGDTLAPYLFIIVLDYILKQTDPDHGIKTHLPDSDICLPDLDFADDIVTFDSNEANAGEHVHNIQSAAAAVGLKINRDKTKILLVNCDLSERLPKSLENLEIVDDFKYLGSS